MSHKPESINEADAAHLVELFDSAGPFVSARSLSDYWLYARLFASSCLCVRNDQGLPIAVIIAFRDQTPGRNEIYVQDVAVSADYRRQGHGEALLAELHRRANEWGVTRLWLTSEIENTGAMKLWLKFGYQNPQADYQESGVWMTRDLKGPGRDRAVYEVLQRSCLGAEQVPKIVTPE